MSQQAQTLTPEFRYKLKSRIVAAGFRNMTEFCAEIEEDLTRLSRVLNGWELPAPRLQQKDGRGARNNDKGIKGASLCGCSQVKTKAIGGPISS